MTETTGITPADIEAKFRDIQGQVDVVAEDSKKRLALAGGAVSVILFLIIYVVGRRAGKRSSSVVEIRRM